MNYRSAVVMGPGRLVEDEAERDHALHLVVDHVVPGRSATLRANTRKELAATVVIAVPLAEASVKSRAGGPPTRTWTSRPAAGPVSCRSRSHPGRSSRTARAPCPTTYAGGSPGGEARPSAR